ncbi:MAG: WXG100 family type VII secretion target [Oscillospiraceae bacterium]
MGNGYTLRVSTEAMAKAQQTFEQRIIEMQTSFDSIETAMNRTNGYWKGDAGDKFRNIYQAMKTKVTDHLAHLNEHKIDLAAMAATYTQAETAAETIAEALPASIIS